MFPEKVGATSPLADADRYLMGGTAAHGESPHLCLGVGGRAGGEKRK